MELHTLSPTIGSVKKRKRIGRGAGSGHGGTSTRGHNGYQSRSGSRRKVGFEGGQMPLQKRIPKYGFVGKNAKKIQHCVINLDKLELIIQKYNLKLVNIDILKKKNIINKRSNVKILGTGNLKSKVDIDINCISKSALSKINKSNH